MAVQRISHPASHARGYQARWPDPTRARGARWTKFFADDAHGSAEHAYRLAQAEERDMRDRAARLRAAMGHLLKGKRA